MSNEASHSEHRAMGWAAIGGTLAAIGAPSGVALAVWGATSRLWSDDYFLAGFAAACALTALGIYVLVAEFIGGLGPLRFPLPPTRHEREASKSALQGPVPSTGIRAAGSGYIGKAGGNVGEAPIRFGLDALQAAPPSQGLTAWIDQRAEEAEHLLASWPASRHDETLRKAATQWEAATYDGLPNEHKAFFRMGVIGENVHLGAGRPEARERAMLKSRIDRLREIAERETT